MLLATGCFIVTAQNSSKSSAAKKTIGNLPANWPWRGVSVESKKTHAKDVDYLASVNANFMRIMLKPNKRAMREKCDPVKAFYAELAWADSLLDEAKQNKMTCLIAFNNLVLDPNSDIDDKSPEFWDDKSYRDSAISMVDIIARRFKNRGTELSAYEVIGEPAVNRMGKSQHPIEAEGFFRSSISTIRKYDQQRYFLLTPGPWGKPANYKGFNGYAIKDTKIIYGAHMYMPDKYTHQGVRKRERGFSYPGLIDGVAWNKTMLAKQMQHVKNFQVKTGALIYFGEFQSVRWAPGGNQWVKDVLDLLEQNNFAWSMYAFQCDTDFWDPYFECVNPEAAPAEWKIQYKGSGTNEWKMFIDYFKLNK